VSLLSRLLQFAFRRNDPEPLAPPGNGDDVEPVDCEEEEEGKSAEEPTSEERRRWPRVQLELQARIRFASPEAALRSHTFDISEGGVFLRLQSPRPKGTTVRLVLEIGDRTMMLSGCVARVSDGRDGPKGVGVAFTKISDVDRKFLADLIAQRQKNRDNK
jgi:uncharacterized protein (TIGR02266 family)